MKIGLIAMSGVRAWSEELNRAGLTMPGIIERGRVIASLPTLSLLTLAALTPAHIEVEYREIKDLRASGLPTTRYDLVAIASQTAQIKDAYAVAQHFRSLGVPVVMGGLHVTAMPDEALEHCSTVVVGEAEPLWPVLIEDWLRDGLKPVYRSSPGHEFQLADSPIPRFDLLDPKDYNRLLIQTSRGCPHRCSFCASSILLTKRYKVKPVERVLAEVRAIKDVWVHPFLEFADDNSFVDREHYKSLCRSLRPERLRWFTECDVSVADDVELLDLMRESGCREVLIGLESPNRAGLDGIELRRNWKLRQLPRYESAVRRIQSRGIAVNGCFVLGLDGDTLATFDEVYGFALEVGLYDVQITVLTPFPGTPLYDQLLKDGRLLHPGAWERCTLFDVNFEPTGMTADQLQNGILELARRLYDPKAVRLRRDRFAETVRASGLRDRAREFEEQTP